MAARGARIDPSASAHVDEAIGDWLGDVIGPAIRDDAKAIVHKKSGRLADSIIAEVVAKVLRVGSTDVDYSVDVELGTAPHVINAKPGSALYWPGADHPVKRVNHPGTKPYPYLRPALFQRRTP
jgi:hypothetical protein